MQTISKVVLGTAQMGMHYGVNNTKGKPSESEVLDLLATAYRSGIRLLDTASAYGNAESLIGKYHKLNPAGRFDVVSKWKKDEGVGSVLTAVETLQIGHLYGLLYHEFDNYLNASDTHKRSLKNNPNIQRLGVSIYTNEQAVIVADDAFLDIVQLPFNLLDNSRLRGDTIEMLKRHGKEVHVRSVFLQGLFFRDRDTLEKLAPLRKYLLQLDELCYQANIDIKTLALAYVIAQPGIDRVLIGVDSVSQLMENLQAISHIDKIPPAIFDQVHNIVVDFPVLLNPVNWS